MKSIPTNITTINPSYQVHRRQAWLHILLPVLLAAIIFISLVIILWLTGFKSQADLTRWSAIATIWLVIPLILGGLVILALIVMIIYLLAKLLKLIPSVSYNIQRTVIRVEAGLMRGTAMIRKPILAIQAVGGLMERVVIEACVKGYE